MNSTEELLAQLRDIQTPEVSGMPAPGWWLLTAAVVLAAFVALHMYRRYQRRAWQREALAELERLRARMRTTPVPQSLSGASRLARRVALVARPRHDVASLQGDAWLAALDDICGKPLFRDGFGKLLEQGPYQPDPKLSDSDLHALMDVVAQLIDAAASGTSRKVGT